MKRSDVMIPDANFFFSIVAVLAHHVPPKLCRSISVTASMVAGPSSSAQQGLLQEVYDFDRVSVRALQADQWCWVMCCIR